jgi:hypothetical protein
MSPKRFVVLAVLAAAALPLLSRAQSQPATTADAATQPATTRPAGPVEITVTGMPEAVALGAGCTAHIQFRSIFAAPLSMQTLGGKPNLYVKAWRNGERMKLPMYPVGDGTLELKPGDAVSADLDLGAFGITRQPGRYLVVAEVITHVASELPNRPPLQIPVKAEIRVAVTAK